MTIRIALAAAALSTAALLSGTAGAANFASQLSEAKVAAQIAPRDVREAALPALNAAQAQGSQDQLNFARGQLGLPVATNNAATSNAVIATPVVAAPAASFDQQLAETKAANAKAQRETRESLAAQISAAEGLASQGKQDEAEGYLNFARGKLGLNTEASQEHADIGGIIGLRPEVR